MATEGRTWSWRGCALRALATVAVVAPLPVLAQEAGRADSEQAASAPSESAMANLVRALVQQGALKADVGADLIRQAEAEAQQARVANQASQASRDLPPAPGGAIRVPYIPETVRAQIKDELRQEVLAEARSGGWAAPDKAAPDWTRRITLHGDVRVRSETQLYSRTNSNFIIDYATLNALTPTVIDNNTLFPFLNSRNDQWGSPRLRARLGVDVAITEDVTAGIMLATGDNQGPISTNSALAGGFLKRDIWLDKAWVRLAPFPWVSGTFGRFAVPFRSSDLLYDNDLNMDGALFELNSDKWLGEDLQLSVRGGAFPFDFGSPDTPTFSPDKNRAVKKLLLAAEVELSGKIADASFSVSAGLHEFKNFQGQLSAPCATDREIFCSTDEYQPIFLTQGNTLSSLRQIQNADPTSDQLQMLGYTFDYRVLDINANVTIPINDSMDVRVAGGFVKNLGFKESDICRYGLAMKTFNNAAPRTGTLDVGTYCDPSDPATFDGGDTGYRFEARLGRYQPKKEGEFNVFAGYRYLETDAVLDGLTDSDFHLGGTNSKGYFLGGTYALRDGVLISGHWMSANEISGDPLAIDVLQLDLEVKF